MERMHPYTIGMGLWEFNCLHNVLISMNQFKTYLELCLRLLSWLWRLASQNLSTLDNCLCSFSKTTIIFSWKMIVYTTWSKIELMIQDLMKWLHFSLFSWFWSRLLGFEIEPLMNASVFFTSRAFRIYWLRVK